jgi:hypothetical protein
MLTILCINASIIKLGPIPPRRKGSNPFNIDIDISQPNVLDQLLILHRVDISNLRESRIH